MKHFISSLSVLCANTPPCEGRVSSRKILSLLLILFLSIGNAWAETVTWEKATSIAAGDVVLLVCETKSMELSSITTYGVGVAYTTTPTGVYELTIEEGTSTGTVSFKNGSTYLNWSSKNTLSTSETKNANSSWTVTFEEDKAIILNVSDNTRKLQWNAGSPRFACYTSTQTAVQLYKKVTTAGGGDETTYSVTLNQPANGTISATGLTDGKAAEGTIVKLTATPDAGYKWDSWTVTGASGNVAVSNDQFTMPAEDVTVTASFIAKTQYTIKWNVAEGSVADTKVYEGEALGSLPTAEICSSGKVFVGWTEATSVNPDGSGITYAKSTDVPAGNKEYNAVYATEITTGGGGATKYVKATTISDGTYLIAATNGANSYAYTGQVTEKTYGGYTSVTISDDEIATKPDAALEVTVKVTDGKFSMHDGTSYLYLSSDGNNLNFIITEKTDWILDNGKIKNAAITASTRYLQFNSASGSERFACYKSTQKDAYLYKKGDGSSTSYTDYSLDCEAHQDPFLTIEETSIDFGTVAQDATFTETLNVSGGYLAEDVALTISGTDASYFSVNPTTITKADEIDQDVTISYNPTATGDHTATLTIKSGEITKTVTLSGTVLAPGKWALVKNVAELSAGDEIIIASAASNYAIGTVASNNYKGAAITKVGETANADASVTVLTVEETGVAEAPFAFKTDGEYLYAASSSANQLKSKTTLDDHGKWAVAITEGVASIVAAKSSNRNVMQCNPNGGSPIFACYASASSSYEPLAIYRNSENVAKPVISGEVNFVGSTQVTITAQSGLTVYYTTNGSDPDNTSTQYTAPFTINATATVKAIAYDASSNASGVAEMTFTKQELVSVATAMALVKDEIAYFDEFEVVKVVAGKGNIYIKDASGHGLIYDNTLAGQLKDGDRVQGFVGISSPYNGLLEAKPYNVTYEDLTITDGTAAQPYDFTSTAIAETDINKYIVFQNVEITENTDMSTNPTLTIGGNSVKFYNQFGVSKTLEADKIYDIYGFVAVYEKDGNRTLQVYFYEAVQDGEVIQKYTVTYNAGGATGTVPVDNAEYSEGAQVYLKSATSLTYEGYEYKGWKVTDKDGNEISVAENKFNMPASNVTVTAQWEEIVVTPRQDFSTGYWVLVCSASELTAGDKIMITAAEEDLAMKSYESGNNCQEIAITKLGEGKFVKWISEVGVFELAANGSNYTIQDVNTKDYLYAAGSGNNNYLKAADEVPTTEEKAKYLWTISFTDGVPTVKATSENRNTLMYNTSSNLFACYASGQKAIALYKYVTSVETTLVTPSVEKGIFSVADGEFVQFSTGNLQYEVGTNTWSFASEQYEVIGGEAYTGSNNTNYGMNEPGYTGKLDLFAWSCDGKFGVNPSNADADYTGEFADWGNLVNETGWYTLTKDEMTYILNRKKDGKKLWALATVCGMNGLILLPDNWNTSTTLEYGYIPADFNYTQNQLDAAAWAALEAAGAVFLPEGGTRVGGHGNKDQGGGPAEFDAHGDYFHVDNVGDYGYYWLNSTTSEKADYLILPGWSDNGTPTDESDDKALAPQVWSREKRRGNSVRLVKEVTPNYTREVRPGFYGTICLENGGQMIGASLFELSYYNEAQGLLYMDEADATMVAGNPYIFLPNERATNNTLYVFYDETTAAAKTVNGLVGYLGDENMQLEGNGTNYILQDNKIKKVVGGNNSNVFVTKNRAYIQLGDVDPNEPAPIPGRRRVAIGQAPQVATGMENVDTSAQPVKTIINGQLFILRGEKMYDAQGKLVK